LANLLQSSRSTFFRGSLLSFLPSKRHVEHTNFGTWGLANSIGSFSQTPTSLCTVRSNSLALDISPFLPESVVDYEAIKAWEGFDADTAKDLATEIREYYIPDFTAWKEHDAFEAAVDRLLRDLKAESRQPHG
jgi:hypothetical protein